MGRLVGSVFAINRYRWEKSTNQPKSWLVCSISRVAVLHQVYFLAIYGGISYIYIANELILGIQDYYPWVEVKIHGKLTSLGGESGDDQLFDSSPATPHHWFSCVKMASLMWRHYPAISDGFPAFSQVWIWSPRFSCGWSWKAGLHGFYAVLMRLKSLAKHVALWNTPHTVLVKFERGFDHYADGVFHHKQRGYRQEIMVDGLFNQQLLRVSLSLMRF